MGKKFVQDGSRVARRAIIVISLALALAPAAVMAQTSFTGTGVGPIPDGPAPCGTVGTPVNVAFAVTGLTGTLTDLDVSTTYLPAHTWAGDIRATLLAPGGTPSFLLFGTVGSTTATGAGDSSDLAGPYVFTDPANTPNNFWTAATAAGGAAAIAAGTYQTSPVGGAGVVNPPPGTAFRAAFLGLTAAQMNGTWTLRLTDGCPADTGTISAATLRITTGVGATAPGFAYAPAAGSTVPFTGGAAPGSTGNAAITVSLGLPVGSGSGAAATTTLTCTAPTAPFAGFGQTITAVGAGALSGTSLSGTCTLGAAAVTQTLTCNENRGGTANVRTWTLSCPAGTVTPLTSTPISGSTVTTPVQAIGGAATTSAIQFQNPGAAAATVTCTAPAATQFTAVPLVINVPAAGNASTVVNYSSATAGSFTGTLNCTVGAQTFTFNLAGSTAAVQAVFNVPTFGSTGLWLTILGVFGLGLLAVGARRH